jgi:hypothetical protein
MYTAYPRGNPWPGCTGFPGSQAGAGEGRHRRPATSRSARSSDRSMPLVTKKSSIVLARVPAYRPGRWARSSSACGYVERWTGETPRRDANAASEGAWIQVRRADPCVLTLRFTQPPGLSRPQPQRRCLSGGLTVDGEKDALRTHHRRHGRRAGRPYGLPHLDKSGPGPRGFC